MPGGNKKGRSRGKDQGPLKSAREEVLQQAKAKREEKRKLMVADLSRWGARPGASAEEKRGTVDGKPSPEKRRHNLKALEELLRHYNNRYPSAGREGLINLQALPKPQPTFGPIDRGENVERIEDRAVFETDLLVDTLLMGQLRQSHWPEYMALVQVYLDPSASPSKIDEWRNSDSLAARMQRDMHDRAIRLLLEWIGDYTLNVIVPEKGRSDFEAAQRERQALARLIFMRLRDAGVQRTEAFRRTSGETGYSVPSLYRIIGSNKPGTDPLDERDTEPNPDRPDREDL